MEPVRPNPTLSDDLITEILLRVPVESLLEFKLVSKSWLSMIKDPAFIKAQLRRAITSETNQTLIMTRYIYLVATVSVKMKFSVFDVDSRQFVCDLKYPYIQDESKFVREAFTIVGSANGIVCVVEALQRNRFYLWNPATRQSRLVLACAALRKSRALGFGYDPDDEDYKIVSVVSGPFRTVVYSANRNGWREVPDRIEVPDFCPGKFHVSVNGFLFGTQKDGMMVFDLNSEVMNCAIKLPLVAASAAVGGDDESYLESYEARPETRIIEYNKSIAVITLWANALNDERTDQGLNKTINMWMLEDDACLGGGGVEATWKLMFSINLGMRAHLLHGYFNNGDLLLLVSATDDYRWISCNASKKEAKIVPVEMDGQHYTRFVYRYTESLVSLAGFKQINWNFGYDDD